MMAVSRIAEAIPSEPAAQCDLFPLDAPQRRAKNSEANKVRPEDRPVHEWYRFVLSYPPHFVRDYIAKLGAGENDCVLDPFCGTGTTLVECKKMGIRSVGLEANPVACFASQVKSDWTPHPDGLEKHAEKVAEEAHVRLIRDETQDQRTLDSERMKLLLTGSISPLPLHKTLVLIDVLEQLGDERYRRHELLALAKCLVNTASNLQFGPEVGVGPRKWDAPVIEAWMHGVRTMARDIRNLRGRPDREARALMVDSRKLGSSLEPNSIDVVITSPPYPNEKDYTRTTRLESVILGFINSKAELRDLKSRMVRSNTRGVYKSDEDDTHVAAHPGIQRIAEQIEARRIELGKTSGFERLYARVAKLYFGGMARHLADLRGVLRPGARLAYVVGDQASYLRILIRTGEILADIARSLGYEVVGIDLFRTRLATATREQLREEVLLLRWPG